MGIIRTALDCVKPVIFRWAGLSGGMFVNPQRFALLCQELPVFRHEWLGLVAFDKERLVRQSVQ